VSEDFVEKFKPKSGPVVSIGQVIPEAIVRLRLRAAHQLLKRIESKNIQLTIVSGMFVAKGISHDDKELLISLREEVLRIVGAWEETELEQSIANLIATKAWTKEIEDAYRKSHPGTVAGSGFPRAHRPGGSENGTSS
jgi:hypothetical protein